MSCIAAQQMSVIPVLLAGEPESSSHGLKPFSRENTEDIGKTLQGDENGFSRLIKRYQSTITAIMYRFSRDVTVVEELVQDVFVQVYRSLPTYRHKAPFEFWLKTIATRVGYRYWKTQKKDPQHSLQDVWESFTDKKREKPSPEQIADFLHTLLETLKPADRLVLTLFYFEGCTMEDIAARTGFRPGAVKMKVHRARNKLKKRITKEHRAEVMEWIQKI